MIPFRIFNTHGIFPFHTRFFIEKGTSKKFSFKNSSLKCSLGNQKMVLHYGIAAKKTPKKPLKECMIFQAILTFTFKWQLANLEFLLLPC